MSIAPRAPRSTALRSLVVALALTACDNDPVRPPSALSLSLTPNDVTFRQGQNTTLTATVASAGGYSETVTVSAEDPPRGVTISSEAIDGGAGTATLEIDASVIAEVGSKIVTVRATGPGVASTSATFALNVESAGGFVLAVDPAAVDLKLGGVAVATIGIGRVDPFTGAVRLDVAGGPDGLTATLDSMVVGGDSTLLTLEADTALASEGRYTLLLRGLGDGVSGALEGFLVTITR